MALQTHPKALDNTMGGYGSGSRGYSSRDTTSAYRGLDVRRWQRGAWLRPGRQFMWQWLRDGHVIASIRVRTELDCVWLSYRHRRSDEPWKDEAYSIHIEWTSCNYGGTRAWFRCPARGCGRRVAILYENVIFACRQCHQLVYESHFPYWSWYHPSPSSLHMSKMVTVGDLIGS